MTPTGSARSSWRTSICPWVQDCRSLPERFFVSGTWGISTISCWLGRSAASRWACGWPACPTGRAAWLRPSKVLSQVSQVHRNASRRTFCHELAWSKMRSLRGFPMATTSQSPAPARPGVFSTGNIVLFLVCLMYGLTYIDRINVNTASLVFALPKELNLDAKHLGWVFSAFGWAYLALQVHGGWLSDRFGARKTLTICGIVWAGATIMMGLSAGFASMIVARVILGLGAGATFPTATRALSDWAPASLRGFVQGITHAFSRLGNTLTPPLVAWLILKTSWRGSF